MPDLNLQQKHTPIYWRVTTSLPPESRLLAKHAPSRWGPWEGLIIDDFFCLSAEPIGASPSSSAAASRVSRARECYDAAQVAGSPHKDVNGVDFFTAAGAQVNATATPLSDGRVFVSAPTPKVLSLAIISLQTCCSPSYHRRACLQPCRLVDIGAHVQEMPFLGLGCLLCAWEGREHCLRR